MKVPGKLTKTEWLLLAVGLAFLAALVLLCGGAARRAQGADYTITTQRQLPEPEEAPPPLEEAGPVNINTAGQEALEALPGIGPVLAQRILDYREANGPFQSLEDLLEVKGIGEKTLEKFRDQITLGEAEPPQGGYQGEEEAAP